MAKGILKFDLDNLDDVLMYKRCLKSQDMALLIWEFSINSRKRVENIIENEDTLKGIDLVFTEFIYLMEKYDVDIDKLVD